MFASPRDARERNGQQMHGNGARRYGEGRAWSPRRFYGLLARASRGRSREKKVIGGGVMPHHATPNHFPTMPPSARRACQRAVEPSRRPHPTLARSPLTISMHLPTISLARVPRTGKHEGAVLRTPRPLVSSEPKGSTRACVHCGAKNVGRAGVAGGARRRHIKKRLSRIRPRGTPEPGSTTSDWR